MMKISILIVLLLTSLSSAADSLKIGSAWIKNLPAVVPMRAGYMTIENNSAQTVTIVEVESEVFTRVEIHETTRKNGMMSMQPLPSLIVSAGAMVKLAPGGIHLMMMQPLIILKPGDLVNVILRFESGNTQTLQMTVRK